ncbi:S-layer homology domain-containing protein [Anaeromicrobium sediminis]|uniref:S-layer homology domain-containing protein n=1 Tax=Anaeromicrobium sediminis TaxID=1478221 RepID=UPI001594F72A|nr:S-layer homology domain-containing protein [Anaeromicrobium sediminis]
MKKLYRHLSITILILIMIFGLLPLENILVYAADEEKVVDLYIQGEKSRGGPIFHQSGDIGNGLWYPGKTESGILRIHNNYSDKMKITNLGMTMSLEYVNGKTVTPAIEEEYGKNMKLQIRQGKMLVFKGTVYDGDFNDMQKNPALENPVEIEVNDDLDLEYTVHMEERAGNNMQGLKATVDFIINSVHNNTTHTSSSGGGSKKSEDVKEHWSHDCIKTLLAKGIINGYPSIKLHPETSMTRAEVAVVLANSLKLKPVNRFFSGYVDALPKWARGHIIAVSDAGVFKGYPGFLFKPNENITREEIATVLIRAFNIKRDKNIMLQFTDGEDISDWAIEYVKTGVEKGMLVGYSDNTFKPQNNITRAEAFTIICKILGYHDEHKK